MIAFNALGKNIEYFNILFLIKKLNIKLILLQNAGDIPNTGEIKKKNVIKYTFRFSYILNYLIFRFLVFLNIFPVIDLYFECRKSIVKNCQNNTFLKKIENIFPIFNFYYFRKTILINSRSYDELIQNKRKISEKNIIFLDSGFFHKDRIVREGKVSKKDSIRYFFLLKKFLFNLSRLYKKKVIICLHPSSNYKIYSKYLKKFKITKYKTIEYINKSFLVIFHESSSVLNAIFLKKKIISIHSKTMGSYLNEKIKTYKEKVGLYSFNLDNKNYFNSKKLLSDLNKRKYTNYIKENINPDGNTPGKIRIINEINKNFF